MNPYERLGLTPSASPAAVTAAFRKLAKETHPDRNPGDPAAAARFDEIANAYRTITQSPPAQSGPTTKKDFGIELSIDLATAYVGGMVSVPGSSGACPKCEGSGFVRTAMRISCQTCGGLGELRANKGILKIRIACQDCGGSGHATKRKCGRCGGLGTGKLAAARIEIPAGCRDGDVFVVQGGANDPEAGFHGDLEVTVRIATHAAYTVNGDDLETTVSIPVWTAALGGKVAIPGLIGGGFTLKVPAGSQPGRRFRLKGKGMPSSGGDLVVTLAVSIPDASDGTAKAAFESLRFVMGDRASIG
jgi:DnaJ-class molecular chaperone